MTYFEPQACRCHIESESPCTVCQSQTETTLVSFNAKGWPVRIIVNGKEVPRLTSIDLKWDIKEQTAANIKLGMIAMTKEEPTP